MNIIIGKRSLTQALTPLTVCVQLDRARTLCYLFFCCMWDLSVKIEPTIYCCIRYNMLHVLQIILDTTLYIFFYLRYLMRAFEYDVYRAADSL